MAMYCPTCQRRSPAGSQHCLFDNTPLEVDPRVGMKLGALQLAEFSEQVLLGPVYRLRGSDEAMLVFEGEAIDPDADFELFLAEIERLNEIDAPQIHRVSAVGEAAGLKFCIQRAPDGIPLSWVLDEAEGQIALGTVIFILHEIAMALAEAHAHGVVHGGLSPDCVRLIGGIEAYSIIVDSFATVRLRDPAELPHPVWDYASADADHRSPTAADDLFALGVIAFELLAGQHPFRQHRRSRYQVPAFSQIVDGMPQEVCELVDRLLSLKPGRRPSAAAVQQALDTLDLPLLLLSHVPDPATTEKRLAQLRHPTTSGGTPAVKTGPGRALSTSPPVVLDDATSRWWLPWALLGLGGLATVLGWWIIRNDAASDQIQVPVARPISAPSLAPGARQLQVGKNFDTVQAALSAAQPQDQILIPPGTYTESLHVTASVTLVGAPGAILRAADGAALTVNSDVRIMGLEIQGASDRHAVRIATGQVLFENATVRGAGGSTVELTGAGQAIFVRSQIRDSAGSGVLASESAQLSLIDTEVTGAARSGIELDGQSSASIRASRVHTNTGAGALVRGDAELTSIGNAVFANGHAGIVTKDRASAEISGTRIYKNQAAGLYVQGLGAVRIFKNRVFENRLAGIEIKDGARPEIRSNLIRDGQAGGVLIHGDARPLLVGNRIAGHGLGVEISDRAEPVLQDNELACGPGDVGLKVHRDGRGRIVRNRIVGCAQVGVQIQRSAPELLDNSIQDCGVGLRIQEGARPRVANNQIRASKTAGVVVDNSAPVLRANQVEGGPVGIHIRGGGTFINNTLSGQTEPWRLEGADDAIRQGNTVKPVQ